MANDVTKASERVASDTPPAINKSTLNTLLRTHKTKSGVIRVLAQPPYSLAVNMLAHTLLHHGLLSPRSAYQHVRNVLNTPLKRQKKKEDE